MREEPNQFRHFLHLYKFKKRIRNFLFKVLSEILSGIWRGEKSEQGRKERLAGDSLRNNSHNSEWGYWLCGRLMLRIYSEWLLGRTQRLFCFIGMR